VVARFNESDAAMLVSRLYFRDVAGRRVFYPFGRIGAGYLIKPPLQQKVQRFVRIWVLGLGSVALAQLVAHAALDEVDDGLSIGFLGVYLALGVAYAVRMAIYVRKLKITPLQLDVK